jgi:hypothetical protein
MLHRSKFPHIILIGYCLARLTRLLELLPWWLDFPE